MLYYRVKPQYDNKKRYRWNNHGQGVADGFLNYEDRPRKITYHVTRKGNVIFDYINILEG